jgi:hypothetical protein
MTSRLQQLAWDRLASTELDPVNPPLVGDAVASILDMMPDSLATEADVKDLAWVIDKQLGKLFNRVWLSSPIAYMAQVPSGKLSSLISSLPADIWNELAWNFKLGGEEIIWFASHLVKQDLLEVGYKLQRKAGTKWALNWIFELLGAAGQVIPWYDEAATANTYRILITGDMGAVSYTAVAEKIVSWCDRFAPKGAKLTEARYNPNGTVNVVLWP